MFLIKCQHCSKVGVTLISVKTYLVSGKIEYEYKCNHCHNFGVEHFKGENRELQPRR